MTASPSRAVEAYVRFLAGSVGLTAVLALLGYAPTRWLGGKPALIGLAAGCGIGLVTAAVGAVPIAVASARSAPGAGRGGRSGGALSAVGEPGSGNEPGGGKATGVGEPPEGRSAPDPGAAGAAAASLAGPALARGTAFLASMALRLATVLGLGLLAVASRRVEPVPLAIWVAISYVAQLVLETRYALLSGAEETGRTESRT
jgi:hypothetical protein